MDRIFSVAIPYFALLQVVIVALRVGAALLFAPIWGDSALPQYLRILLVFAVAVAISSVTPLNIQPSVNPITLIPGELLIGLLLAAGIRIVMAGLHLGGQIIGYHLGFSAVQTIDPTTANRSTLMSGFLSMFGYVLILATDQHHQILRALAASYKVFPVGVLVQPGQWFDTLIAASSQIFVIGWRIALPVFAATFLVEVTVAFVARMQPQMNVMIVTAPLKLLVGMSVLGASLAFLPQVIAPVINMMVLHK